MFWKGWLGGAPYSLSSKIVLRKHVGEDKPQGIIADEKWE
jgi:hypothetical protein